MQFAQIWLPLYIILTTIFGIFYFLIFFPNINFTKKFRIDILNNMNPKKRKIVEQIGFLRINSLTKSILIPILLVILLKLFFLLILPSFRISFSLTALDIWKILFAPIIEEIAFRACLLGLPLYILLQSSNLQNYQQPAKLILLIISATAFSYSHENTLDLRYLIGLVFGIVYLVDKYNLFPAILAHQFSNLLAIIIPT